MIEKQRRRKIDKGKKIKTKRKIEKREREGGRQTKRQVEG